MSDPTEAGAAPAPAPAAPAAGTSPSTAPPATGTSGSPAPAGTAAPAAPQAHGWLTQVPKELREHPALAKHQKMGDLLQEYLDLSEKSVRAIYLPGAESTPEELDAFLHKMGIPKDAKGYKLDEDLLKDVPGGKEFAEEFRKQARGAGLTGKQASKFYEFVAGISKGNAEAQKAQEKAMKETFNQRLLEAMGGNEVQAKEASNRLVSFMTQRVKDPELVKDMAARGILYDPRYVKLFAQMEERLGDAPYIDGQGKASARPAPGGMGSYSPTFAAEYGKRKA